MKKTSLFIIITQNNLAFMIVPLQEKSHVIFYKGSFDPPHDGHRFVVQNALRQTGAQFAIVIAHDQPNAFKKNCSPHHLRVQMLEQEFGGLANVIICKESNASTEKKYLQTAYVSLLIGADVWEHFSRKEEIKYHQVLVSGRTGSSLPKVGSLHGKPVKLIPCDYPKYSSTKLRKFLLEHPGLYESTDKASQQVDLPIASNELRYILNQGLYASSDVVFSRQVKVQIQHHTKLSNIACLNLLKKGGLSGDFVFTVTSIDDIPQFFVKAFHDSKEANVRKENETRANRLLNSLHFKTIQTPELKWVVKCEGFTHMGQAHVPLKDLSTYLRESSEMVETMSRKIGRSLLELHSHTKRAIDKRALEEWCAVLMKKGQDYIKRFGAHLNPDFLHELENEFLAALGSYKENPGTWCYVHGDANPGNYFVDPETEIVTMVDLNSMINYVDQENGPRGYAGYEYYQMISSFHLQHTLNQVDAAPVEKAIKGFVSGYQDMGQMITPEAHQFFCRYWSIRTALGYRDPDVQSGILSLKLFKNYN